MGDAKTAVKMLRNRGEDKRPSMVRFVARKFRTTVPEIHAAAGCVNGKNCTGQGCRI